MKRFLNKNIKVRQRLNSVRSKLIKYTNNNKFYHGFSEVYNICILSYYSKSVLTKFHVSSKTLKFLFREGLIFGVTKASF